MLVRVTVYRVYPSCKRIGSFTFRARAGVNRIPFRGRVGGRPLREGGYRLVFRARGAERDAAAVPIVVARGHMSRAQVHRARTTVVCDHQIAELPGAPADSDPSANSKDRDGLVASIADGVAGPIGGAAGVIASAARALPDRITNVVTDEPFDDPFVLTMVGLLTLAIALLGTIVITNLARNVQRR